MDLKFHLSENVGLGSKRASPSLMEAELKVRYLSLGLSSSNATSGCIELKLATHHKKKTLPADCKQPEDKIKFLLQLLVSAFTSGSPLES
jgi:hypothetical protein